MWLFVVLTTCLLPFVWAVARLWWHQTTQHFEIQKLLLRAYQPAPATWTQLVKKWGDPRQYGPLHHRWPFENIVFEGGGVRGSGYAAVVFELERRGVWSSFKRFSGSSAGAIMAAFCAAKFTPTQVATLLLELPMPAFFDRSHNLVSTAIGFIREYGWFSGQVIEDYIQAAMASACNLPTTTIVTFDMLHKHTNNTLVVTTFRPQQNGGKTLYLSHLTTPHMSVAKAVHASSAFPGIWTPVEWDGFLHADGGSARNDALYIFNSPFPCEENRLLPLNPKTLNVRLYDSQYGKIGGFELFTTTTKVTNIYEYYMCFLNAILNQLDQDSIVKHFWKQTITVDCNGVSALNVTLTEEQKAMLLENGHKATVEFLKTC